MFVSPNVTVTSQLFSSFLPTISRSAPFSHLFALPRAPLAGRPTQKCLNSAVHRLPLPQVPPQVMCLTTKTLIIKRQACSLSSLECPVIKTSSFPAVKCAFLNSSSSKSREQTNVRLPFCAPALLPSLPFPRHAPVVRLSLAVPAFPLANTDGPNVFEQVRHPHAISTQLTSTSSSCLGVCARWATRWAARVQVRTRTAHARAHAHSARPGAHARMRRTGPRTWQTVHGRTHAADSARTGVHCGRRTHAPTCTADSTPMCAADSARPGRARTHAADRPTHMTDSVRPGGARTQRTARAGRRDG